MSVEPTMLHRIRTLWPVLASLALACLLAVSTPPARAAIETPDFAEPVAEGALPPVASRLPAEPKVVDLAAKDRKPGVHGGMIRMFVTRAKDVRYMAAWGYARLVGYNERYELEPDILKAVEIGEDGRSYTLVLRPGHRWSDGHPFTTEDFRYWWEDVALNPELSPAGPPVEMLVGGEPPVVEVLDETRIRFTWPAPNPRLLPALAQARPLYIYRPAHYVKQFHAAYADPAALGALVAESKARNWAQLHNRMDDLYNFDNPELPVLQPWVNSSDRNNQRYVLARNPYYHRVDTNGRQLPYLDSIELEVAAGGLIPAKATLGEADLQVRSLGFSDAPVLKKNEAAGGYVTHLWRSGTASEVAIYPNLTYADPVWRAVFRDVRFRRAISLAISRKAINKVLYFGLAEERALAALEESPFFDPVLAQAWADFDLDEANRLLDEMGLDARNSAGIRLLPDGRPMEIVIETAGERREETDALQIVAETWKRAGIRLLVKALDRDILRNRAYAGLSMMVAWYGWNNGVPTPDAPPFELAPVDQANFTWPKWGQYFQTKGAAGEPVDLPEAMRLLELFEKWSTATDDDTRSAAWREMLEIHADQVFCIGIISRAPLPVVADRRLRNVPHDALYAWDPGAQLGIHRMDEFWFDAHDEGSLAQGTRP
ncbi:ABC transporter substrate-binding protein [Limibaculum sp. FT325]|uniref:ABC transporter substrate-binding protein n=1 Tax=Thermohalobaculum sediminis TaxID=2939436 RepID=UPI0020BECB2E|nr:ABC transporter substrate-binding protein [Limibaculum sediminis]MCL5778148.1 ABC transporter substrate-binding protein [Limibaculum sediminis]